MLLWDERLSTAAAERALLEADASRRRRAEVIDKVAATLILQSALDRMKLPRRRLRRAGTGERMTLDAYRDAAGSCRARLFLRSRSASIGCLRAARAVEGAAWSAPCRRSACAGC